MSHCASSNLGFLKLLLWTFVICFHASQVPRAERGVLGHCVQAPAGVYEAVKAEREKYCIINF